MRALRELGTSVALVAAPGAAATGGGVRESDAAFLAAKARAAALERQLADASAAAERLVGRAAAACDALGDAGLALVRLSKSEEAEGARRGRLEPRGAAQRLAAADARAAGAAAVRACRLGRAAAGQLAAQLQPLHAHLAMAPAVARAAADRADALLTWQTLAAEADAKRAKTARVEAEPLKVRCSCFHLFFLAFLLTRRRAIDCVCRRAARSAWAPRRPHPRAPPWTRWPSRCVADATRPTPGRDADSHDDVARRRSQWMPPSPPRRRSTPPSARETRQSSRASTRSAPQTSRCVLRALRALPGLHWRCFGARAEALLCD